MAMTRRKWLTTMGSGTLVAGVGAVAARGFGALGGGSAHHFQQVAASGRESARATLQQRHLLNLPLTTQDGKNVKFYDDLVKDKKVVLTFMNTDPKALASSKKVSENLATLQKFFGSRMGKDIHFYTITANPTRDTQQVLQGWSSQYSSGSGWTFLTGNAANVDKLRHSLGFADEFGMDITDPNFSVGVLRYGTEPEMRWAHCQSLAAPRVIAHAMLLDFGTDPADPSPPPVWNCSKLVGGLA
jgi:protein SCO1/2